MQREGLIPLMLAIIHLKVVLRSLRTSRSFSFSSSSPLSAVEIITDKLELSPKKA